MKLSVRLTRETIEGINDLKKILEEESQFAGLSLTNGFVVNYAYQESKEINWNSLISTKCTSKERKDILEIKTNLTLSQATIDGINELKKELPQYLENISHITTSYVILLVIRSALMQRAK